MASKANAQDKRSRYTRMFIKEAMTELLSEKNVEKITVKELCDHAEIHRNTFYLHYDSVFDVLDEISDEYAEKAEACFRDAASPEQALVQMFKVVQNNKASSIVYGPNQREPFCHKLSDITSRYLIPPADAETVDKGDLEYFTEFAMRGLSGIIKSWIENEYRESPEHMGTIAAEFIARGYSSLT